MKADWLLLILGFAAVATAAFAWLRARRLRNEKRVLKEEIKTWEGEGGNVPEIPTVSPVASRESKPAAR